MTTSRYYTPSGRSIQAEGIEPDIEVQPARIEEVDISKRRYEGDLRGALDADKKGRKKSKKIEIEIEETTDEKKHPRDPDGEHDFQLARAVDLLRGLAIYNEAQR